jgi:hypothetical protein
MTAERIKREIEKRIQEASDIKDLNRYMIEEHERIKKQEIEQKKLNASQIKEKNRIMQEEDERKMQ